jgi:hypothetical protein
MRMQKTKASLFLDRQLPPVAGRGAWLIFANKTGQYSRSMFPPARLAKSRP